MYRHDDEAPKQRLKIDGESLSLATLLKERAGESCIPRYPGIKL